MPRRKIQIDAESLQQALVKTAYATHAAKLVGLSFGTFKRRCAEHGISIVTNQGRPGVLGRQHRGDNTIPLDDVLNNHVPFKTGRLKQKLLAAGFLDKVCAACGIGPTWNSLPLTLQLDHINGNKHDNSLRNLRLLCPNCHTQTPTWGRKKRD